MSWANVKELIFQERKTLDPLVDFELPQENPFETQHSALLSCYLHSKPYVEDAVCTFAQTLEWPPLTPMLKFFIIARLDFAWEIASVMNTARDGESFIPYPSPAGGTTSELLEWLLIDIWPYGCSRFLQAQRSSMASHSATPQALHSHAEVLSDKRVA